MGVWSTGFRAVLCQARSCTRQARYSLASLWIELSCLVAGLFSFNMGIAG